MTNKGLCYINAFKYFTNLPEDNRRGCKLVHGIVLLNSGEEAGTRDGHAWIELNDKVVIDPSKNIDEPDFVPKHIYYAKTHVREKELHKYSLSEATEKYLVLKHYGPWEDDV